MKKSYTVPKLTVCGTVEDLTNCISPPPSCGGGGQDDHNSSNDSVQYYD